MHERKLVKSGEFSFTISLPKEWVLRNKLSKGSPIYVDEQEGVLLLSPKTIKTENQSPHKILRTDGMTKSSVLRDIVAAYLMNFKNFTLTGEDLWSDIDFYKAKINELPGLEIIEETSRSLMLKDFIDIDEVSIPVLFRRSDNVIRSMLSDLILCIRSKDEKLSLNLIQRDGEVNKLTFLTYKCLNYLADHTQKAKAHGVNSSTISHIWEVNGYLEKIADEIKRIAKLSIPLRTRRREIAAITEQVAHNYMQVMMALYKHDIGLSDRASAERHAIKIECQGTLTEAKNSDVKNIVSKLIYIINHANSISRVTRYIKFEKDHVKVGDVVMSKTC